MGFQRTLVLIVIAVGTVIARDTRWCVVNRAEEAKCQKMKSVIQKMKRSNVTGHTPLPSDFMCVRRNDVFECMEAIELDDADLMTLDSGQGYFAGRQHNMMPIMAENYENVTNSKPTYYAVAMFRTNKPVSLDNLNEQRVCFPAIGTSAGWLYPISRLIRDQFIVVEECNAIVKAASTFFKQMCLPGALTSFYNPFGNNPTSVCELCSGQNEEFCTTSDTSGGFDGAFRCLAEGRGDLTFLRHDTIQLMTDPAYNIAQNVTYTPDQFRLVCPDRTTRSVDEYLTCNWGQISSNIIMTSAVRSADVIQGYKAFLTRAFEWFGPYGKYKSEFEIFRSNTTYDTDEFALTFSRKNQMFSDQTKRLEDVVGSTTYFEWVGNDFDNILDYMNACPSNAIRWCVISEAEKQKCESMMLALKAKDLRPELDCLYGKNTTTCMEMIYQGDADLINLDAGDVYLAGRRYGLVPIASEDYGDMSMKFKVVAVARKTDKHTTLFNMKDKRSCQPGIGRGDGWIVPLNIYIETEQFLPTDCSIFNNIGQLFVRSCIPGALDKEYNPNQTPISLCEGCAAGGYRKCLRNSDEQYFGSSGAFRCLVEKGGDVAFVRHLTVRDNTDGRNHAIWARNRRSDDYELMCKDGRRLNIDFFNQCHLGEVPANAIVTSGRKTTKQREIMWNLINYGQQFFSSDIDGDFHMFHSGNWYSDLLFTDAAVRLMKIPEDRQNYKTWLGENFIAQIENLQKYTCVNPDSASQFVPSLMLIILISVVAHFLS
ncbi:melanotransferrin-like [Pomacea canaliculata]|uniref:melanotransferrin-like n=1 Tax=Pomacea canaliculata TaxID=400727 RepID=UPI000D72E110|nr:melanotransferrin-like [Pomacea canaliculata]